MSDSTASLRRKISGAGDLQSVVRAMKAVAASSIGQYEKSVEALGDYSHTVQLGLSACLRESTLTPMVPKQNGEAAEHAVAAVVFGSDQGLVGQFNDIVADHAHTALADIHATPIVWVVGERVQTRLADSGMKPAGSFAVPTSVKAITPLVGQILMECEKRFEDDNLMSLYLFYNRPTTTGAYEPVTQRLLPLDAEWRRSLVKLAWPTSTLPEIVGGNTTLRALISEYVFVSLFRACAESLAGENASRLAAMQRAEKNINELLVDLNSTFHRLRQSGIDEELFDVVSGFEALSMPGNK